MTELTVYSSGRGSPVLTYAVFHRALAGLIALYCAMTACAQMTRADAALRIATNLEIPHNDDPKTLYGLFPGVFPGAFNGAADVSEYQKRATLENIVVAVVRWVGWDTIHYDSATAQTVAPYVSPEGFPYYAPDPTPRSIPYIAVALKFGLLTSGDLPQLRRFVNNERIDRLCTKAQAINQARPLLTPMMLDENGMAKLKETRIQPGQLLILPLGFSRYEKLTGLPNRVLDLNAPNLRLFNAGSSFATGKQDYFPLGAIESQLAVGLHVSEDSYTHESQAIHGSVENASPTVNGVGIWSSAISLKRDARVWGQFVSASSAHGPKNDAQVVGLEVDVLNYALPGVSPNRSKTGIQIVGIGNAKNTAAVEVMAGDNARWMNGLLFEPGAIHSDGSVIGLAGANTIARGINFANTKFTDSAFLVSQGSTITFGSKSGAASAIYTDAIGNGYLVLRAGQDGIRVTNNENSQNLLVVDNHGGLQTPMGTVAIRVHAPRNSDDSCVTGTWASDQKYFYLCIAPNTWRRAGMSSW